MFEGDPTATTPMSPVAPRPPARRSGGVPAGRLLALGLLAFALAAFTGRVDLATLITTARSYVDQPAPAAQTNTSSSDTAAVAAVKAVVERANQAQAQAYARNDPTLMRATATDSYYQELVQTNQGIQSSGARSIELVSLDWVDVTVSGARAQATTTGAWRTTYTAGSVAESTDRNDYTLVLQSGAWKISADVQPTTQIINPSTGTAPGVTQPGTPASVTSSSSNWSGYAATGGTFTSVSATWTVPTVASTSTGADATWVGIGGLSSSDLIQAGTQAMVDGNGVTYTSWIEMLPQSSRDVPLSVSAGDSVTVSITQQSGAGAARALRPSRGHRRPPPIRVGRRTRRVARDRQAMPRPSPSGLSGVAQFRGSPRPSSGRRTRSHGPRRLGPRVRPPFVPRSALCAVPRPLRTPYEVRDFGYPDRGSRSDSAIFVRWRTRERCSIRSAT